MTPLFKRRGSSASRHADPGSAVGRYLEELRRAEASGAPVPASVLNSLGDAHLDQGDVAAAIGCWRQAAEVYEREGLFDNAVACCRKIRRHDPEDAAIGGTLGRILAAKGLHADAVAELGTHADRQVRLGGRREAIETLREIARLAPEAAERREQLARFLGEDGQRQEALLHLRAALETYRGRGDADGEARAAGGIARLEPDSAGPSGPARVEPESGGGAPRDGLDIERTSYPEAAPAPANEAPVTVGQQYAGEPEDFASVTGAPGLDTGRLTEDAIEVDPDRMVAWAETEIAAGQPDTAAGLLSSSAQGFRRAGRPHEAIVACRRLAALERATPDDFALWAECARETGEASNLLEALAAAARWHLAAGDPAGARRAAEEMLLVDPANGLALDTLARTGTTLPRG